MARASFGIISGAGPMAGVCLLGQTIKLFQRHGCWRDADFPTVHMINYPFSDMLENGFDQSILEAQLRSCIINLRQDCEYIVIACNTLHLFLSKEKIPQLVNLIKLAKKQLPKNAKPLVLASRTTAKEKLYDKLLGIKCEYWQPEQSQAIINDILQGKKADLSWIVGLAKTRTVILGCTEYSLAMENYPLIPNLIDPLKLAAQKFFEIFNKA